MQSARLRQSCYVVLCATPFIAMAAAAPRALRIPGVHQVVGIALAAAMLIAIWLLVSPDRDADAQFRIDTATSAGIFFLLPFVLITLLWVGIAPPFQATAAENRMRYEVLLANGILVTLGIVLAREHLSSAGERVYSTLGFGLGTLAGAGYLVWNSFALGTYVLLLMNGSVPPELKTIGNTFDVLLFAVGALTYAATACIAVSLGRVGWLGRRAVIAYVVVNLVALAFLVLRGLSFPDARALAEPWYLQPGFIAGIPAIPWIMPALLGAVLLRRGVQRTRVGMNQ